MLNYISVCSGIEAASLAWEPLGWKPLLFSEIEPFPCKVLAHRWPDMPNMGDMTQFHLWPENILAECDLIIGGCPCQAFSVAGLRQSLDDHRGNLTLVYIDLINHIDGIRRKYGKQPVIVLYENVPGILNTHDNALGCFFGGLCGEEIELQPAGKRWSNAGVVYGPERALGWRILDAQFFGVAQRRRRVFVVASAGNGFDPFKILFEPESVRRDTPPSRKAGEDVASYAPSSINAYREGLITLRANGGDNGGGSEGLIVG